MKKFFLALAFSTTLVTGTVQAQAALLADWNYEYNINFDNYGSESEKVNPNADFITDFYFYNSHGMHDLSPVDGYPQAHTGKLSLENNVSNPLELRMLFHNLYSKKGTTDNNFLADLNFYFNVASANGEASMAVNYTIPLYTYYDAANETTFVYYNTADVIINGSNATTTYGNYEYNINDVQLFVDGRALKEVTAENGNTYTGWALNSDTLHYYYDDYVVGATDNIAIEKKFDRFERDPKLFINGAFGITANQISTPPAPTPEPATILLTSLGLAGIGIVKRRRKTV